MASGDDDSDVEWLDLGLARGSDGAGDPAAQSPIWHGRRRWYAAALVSVVAVILVSTLRHPAKRSAAPPSHPPQTAATSASSRASSARPSATPSTRPPVAVTQVGHPLLGESAGWDLFVRGDDAVVRIQLGLGRITRTVAPAVGSTGPASFVVGSDRAIVRPLDQVDGYVVPDGRAAQPLTGSLAGGGLVYPGPDPEHLWVQRGDSDRPRIDLVGIDGRPTGVSLPIPTSGGVSSDGTGYLVFTDVGGAYRMRPDGLRRITPGALLAVGPTRWLTEECDDAHRCTSVVIDRASGERRIIGPGPTTGYGPVGVISPDGATAALVSYDNNDGTATPHLLDLASGVDRRIAAPLNSENEAIVVWSPDSRWLFGATTDGQLAVIDPRTAHVRDLGIPLPHVSQLAVRSASP